MKDRIKLAEAMGWVLQKGVNQSLWIPPENYNGARIYQLPDPENDANDDYAVLEWAKKQDEEFWGKFCVALTDVVGNYAYLWEYHVGYFASAVLRVLD